MMQQARHPTPSSLPSALLLLARQPASTGKEAKSRVEPPAAAAEALHIHTHTHTHTHAHIPPREEQ